MRENVDADVDEDDSMFVMGEASFTQLRDFIETVDGPSVRE